MEINFLLVFYSVIAVGIYHLVAHLILAVPRAVSICCAVVRLNRLAGVTDSAWVWRQCGREAWRQLTMHSLRPRVVLAKNFRGSVNWCGLLPRRWTFSIEQDYGYGHSALGQLMRAKFAHERHKVTVD